MRERLAKLWTSENVKKVFVVLSLIMAVTFIMPYIDFDFEFLDEMGLSVSDFVETKITPCRGGELLIEDGLLVDGFEYFEDLFRDEMIAQRVMIFVLISYIVLVINLLCFLRKEWGKTFFAILHTIAFLLFQSIRPVFSYLEDLLKESMNDELGMYAMFLDDMTKKFSEGIGDILNDSLSFGYWIFTVAGILVYILLILDMKAVRRHILGATMSKTSFSVSSSNFNNVDYSLENHGMIRVLSGKYASAEIAVQEREYIIVGRDPKQCHIILDAPIVSGVHCKIRFSPEQNVYYVLDRSTNGTFLVNNPTGDKSQLIKEQENRLVRGSIITIGNNGDQILLV